ncbi:response regulator [Pseudomonas sp. ADAK18]|uniref:response regulator n=1 Tax=Pseudomonas sp. ADAK18 TaxID=2730848 RepID=UPI0014628DBA|nr:response regulator [Pseudomonas sp. ADAK18]QJI31259.1 response regulator [Pseudomonas sp. ADAK18]
MPTPSLRILIVDDQPAQRLSIEKMLNQQGYHRIAPVATFAELLAMVEGAIEPFDLLVINSALGADATFNLDDFFRNCPAIRHTLVYDGLPRGEQEIVLVPGSRVIKRLLQTPDEQTIRNLMLAIDSPKGHPTRSPCLRWVP